MIISIISIIIIPINWAIKKIKKDKNGVKIGYLTYSFTPIKVDKTIKNNLQMIYKGKTIGSIRQSYIRIYNDGTKSLKREDFYGSNMKLYSTENILDIEIVNQRFSGGNFSIKNKDKNEYVLDFDYFESGQVIDIRALQKEGDLSLSCEAVGVRKLFKAKKSDLSPIIGACLFSIFCIYVGCESFSKIPGNWYWYLILFLCLFYFDDNFLDF